MKKIIIFTLLAVVISNITYAQTSFKSVLGWNKALGVGIGYTKMYKEFDTQYGGISAPQDLIHFDLTLYGVYAGVDFMVKDTGYDVYGYNEKLSTCILKFGPSFRIGREYKVRQTVTPYAGVAFYSLFDSSNNDIGARDEYGNKESKFVFGCKIAAICDWYYLSAHFSNRECGLSVGIEFIL